MKLRKKNILIILVFCFLGLALAFSFQNGYSSSFFRELATDSGFDSDFGGGSSGGGGGGYSGSSSSDFGGSSGGGSNGADPFTIVFGLIISVVVVYPILSHFNEKRYSTIYLLLISLLFGFVLASFFSIPLFFVIILISIILTLFPPIISIPVLFVLFGFGIFGLVCLRKSIIKSMIENKRRYEENKSIETPSEDYFSSVLNDPNIVKEAYDIYVKIQKAWAKNDLSNIKDLVSDTLYNMYRVQIKTSIKKNQRNEMSDFKFVEGYIYRYESYDERDVYNITLRVLCKDYLVDNDSNEVIRGDSNRINDYTYLLSFVKYKKEDIKECPNCKAPIPSSGERVVCEYCGSVINKKSTSMILTSKKMLKQR